MLRNRLARSRDVCVQRELDGLIVLKMQNIRYLTGFTGSDGAVLAGMDDAWFLTDSRYVSQAGEEVSGLIVDEYRAKLDGLSSLLRDRGFRRVGFESETVSVSLHRMLSEMNPEVAFIPLGRELEDIRSLKDPDEIRLLGDAASLASEAFKRILPMVEPGRTEQELSLALEWEMRSTGADEKSFDFIVASGERGAFPHGRASNKAIAPGELITFDFGAVVSGYSSDETVTVAVGNADQRQREVYSVVLAAHDQAIDRIRPGVPCRDIDRTARDYIAAQGYGAYFGHGLGHGVGLEVHERPVLSPRSEDVLQEGMVVTVEPGIYIPGWGGVRIEDTVVVTATGCTLLTQVPKDLRIL